MNGTAERVAVLAPTGQDAQLACQVLQSEGINAERCESIEQLCSAARDGANALLIAEEALAPSALAMLVQTLDAQPRWSDIPVIVMAGGDFSLSSVRPLSVLGPLRNVMILERPVRRLIFVRTVAIGLRGRRRQLELRSYMEERAELLEREQLANRMKDEFLMTVSHELRTPLTAIYGWARMLVTGELRDDQRQRAAEVIERNAEAQAQIVNDLLDVSRAISGKVRLNLQAIELGQVVSAAVESMQPTADAKGVHIEVDVDASPIAIAGDRDRLQQVVWNLLSNAIKFTPAEGRVRVRAHRLNSHVELVVSDTGQGIDSAFLPHVFDRFRQGDAGTTREHGGLGLGTAIVRHLVELHGGTIAAESDGIGHGATFRIVLPTRHPHPASGLQASPGAPIAVAGQMSHRLRGMRVLVVDDEPHARELFAAIVENAGAEVRVAGSARDALEVVRTWSPHVMLSDIEMPHEDGYHLMEQIEALEASHEKHMVAIAVTAHSRHEDRIRGLEVGFKWHLAKPVEPAELVAVVAALASRVVQR